MSDRSISRRTAVEISFEGVDITTSIRPYLKSLTYTDHESDEADDLQITLQDREGIWMEQWLNDVIDTAGSRTANAYTVLPKAGLNVRKSPSTSAKKLGALSCGSKVSVSKIENGWATISYNSTTAYVNAAYLKQGSGKTGDGTTGLSIEAVIIRQNWNGDGRDELLECGLFELDSVECDGPPAEVTIKATSLPFNARIRQTEKSRGWENYRLSGIAEEIARDNDMTCLYLCEQDPFYEREEQYRTSDIAFLKRCCDNAGISLKASSKMLILFDQTEFERKEPVLTIRKERAYTNQPQEVHYLDYRLSVGTADVQYQSCRVSYTDPDTGRCIEGIAKIPDYSEKSEKNQQLEVTEKVSSIAEAKRLAEKRLRLHNKYCRTAEFTLPGNPALVAGVTVALSGWGSWDGICIVKQANHQVSENGYTTSISLRRILEGY